MIEISKNIVAFTPEEVVEIIQKALAEKGIERQILGMQIAVEEPFGDGMRIHNEIPRLNIVLAGAGA
jgi:hypothetical protein